ncbi:hypothetical protein QR98_0091530 [Sarcoptes scabiei]|uniref:Uncharacterized protein n=1 Tax=Sarcoptes scabiei TaxID=52283 RepID=A0A132AHX4_SARSC|nr:hypothetical protein QR98_0091530 [Sarcoptes scabiei]
MNPNQNPKMNPNQNRTKMNPDKNNGARNENKDEKKKDRSGESRDSPDKSSKKLKTFQDIGNESPKKSEAMKREEIFFRMTEAVFEDNSRCASPLSNIDNDEGEDVRKGHSNLNDQPELMVNCFDDDTDLMFVDDTDGDDDVFPLDEDNEDLFFFIDPTEDGFEIMDDDVVVVVIDDDDDDDDDDNDDDDIADVSDLIPIGDDELNRACVDLDPDRDVDL